MNELVHRELITIQDIQNDLNISNATIKNWIKLGYILPVNDNYIDKQSYDKFLNDYIGKYKLNARANKQYKTDFDDSVKNKYKIIIASGTDAELIAFQYEKDLSESYKNKEGIFYTPSHIIASMMECIDDTHLSDKVFLDPACGTGNFLIAAIKKGFSPENIYGYDTDEIAVEITKKRIYQLTGYKASNIYYKDFLWECSNLSNNLLSSTHHLFSKKVDYIFTNPPWGKKINIAQKKLYSKLFNAGNSTDTSALFLFASLNLIKNNGLLGFLLPEAVFNISSYENIRQELLKWNITSILNFGKGFKELMTTTQAILIKKNKSYRNNISIKSFNKEKEAIFKRNKMSFNNNPKKIFNFWITQQESKVIDKIFSHPFITLKNHATWGMGIVTGNNKEFCKNVKLNDDFIPVWKGEDILPERLREISLFIHKDLSKYQQVAPKEYYEAKEKIIYRFITPRLCFYSDDKQRYILNSANFFILNKDFPIQAQTLVKYLNSNIINWLFQSLFKTHKILRSDLEEIPIITEYFNQYEEFNEEQFLSYLNIKITSNGSYRIKK